jgi:hypothetical protein
MVLGHAASAIKGRQRASSEISRSIGVTPDFLSRGSLAAAAVGAIPNRCLPQKANGPHTGGPSYLVGCEGFEPSTYGLRATLLANWLPLISGFYQDDCPSLEQWQALEGRGGARC